MQANNVICYLTEVTTAYPKSRGNTDWEGLSRDKMGISLMDTYGKKKIFQIALPMRLKRSQWMTISPVLMGGGGK